MTVIEEKKSPCLIKNDINLKKRYFDLRNCERFEPKWSNMIKETLNYVKRSKK